MSSDCISYQKSGYFSKLIEAYLDESSELKFLYNRFPKSENFQAQISEKQENYRADIRATLVAALTEQNQYISLSEASKNNIQKLQNTNTFTITTGHQLILFTGPLYFIYKIISAVKLSQELKKSHPENDFVPVFWMATEDHDFEEISSFTLKGKKIHWNTQSKGPVGRLSTHGLEAVFEVFSRELGLGKKAYYLKDLFKKAYLQHSTLAEATRYLVNELFAETGLVIIDGDDVKLKKQFIPFIKNELIQQTAYKSVTESIQQLKAYNIQVNPREINLFYIEDDLRERIIFENDLYKVNNTPLEFTPFEILALIENHPEKFSPNVLMRPLYQEVVLPNLAYIGGGGEIAYWLELKSFFESQNVTFPILMMRDSVLLVTEKQQQKKQKLEVSYADLFLKQQMLIQQKTTQLSKFPIDVTDLKNTLKKQFSTLHDLTKQTDKSFLGAVLAQEKKQLNGLDKLEKRLLKAQIRKHTEQLSRITELQNELFPNQGLQERQLNFAELYEAYGNVFFEKLMEVQNPLKTHFKVIFPE